ncbi:hypothetical protein FQA39_LY15254 [Lamprigera yunnana]|nr:hypothetical protein FQA39_LY15254 [Lamprigera yunnana]
MSGKWEKERDKHKRGRKDVGESSRSTGRHPGHLRGKEIGLYYAKRQWLKNEENKRAGIITPRRPIAEVNLSDRILRELENLLENTEECANNVDHAFKSKFEKLISGKMENRAIIERLARDNVMDAQFREEFDIRKNNVKYQNMLEKRKKLPSYEMKNDIVHTVASNQVVVISGETGCGKTTQVAQFILDDFVSEGKGSLCRIVCTQPRRISAISIAERVAEERTEDLGAAVGYQIRLEKVLPRDRGSIVFCTTGVVLRQMEGDPYLSNISHVILDEIHERDVRSDLLMTLFKQILAKRPDLKLILMSATLNANKFSAYYNDCPHLNIPGFTYPVEEFYLEDVLQRTDFAIKNNLKTKQFKKWRKESEFYSDFMEPYVRQLQANKTCSAKVCEMLRDPQLEEDVNLDLIFALIVNICETEQDKGAILVFLTGFMEISNLNKLIEKSGKFPTNKYLIIPLHSQMPTVNQRHVFERPPLGIRKIVLSTNIAETSITIDDVVFVIDCGKIKMTDYDAEADTYTLKPQWVALANANQRKGRAGRVQPGVCFHLFSRPRNHVLEQYQKPEILRTRLENTVLTIKSLQLGNAVEFLEKLMDPPSKEAISVSLELLKRLNALDGDESLTPLGYHLAKLPIAPQMGKMVLFGALFSCLDPVLSVAASLDFKDAFIIPLGKEPLVDERRRALSSGWLSDHLVLFNALYEFEHTNIYSARKFCTQNFLSINILSQLQKMKTQFMNYLYETKFVDSKDYNATNFNLNSKNVSLIKAIICAGLYPNVGTIVGKKHKRPRTLEGIRVHWHPKSILHKELYFPSPLFVYYLRLKSTSNYVHDATIVHPLPLIFFGDKYCYDHESGTIDLADKQLRFKCSENTSNVIKCLRKKLNWYLEYKISHPGVVDWNTEGDEIMILRSVMQLITNEELGLLDLDYDDFE